MPCPVEDVIAQYQETRAKTKINTDMSSESVHRFGVYRRNKAQVEILENPEAVESIISLIYQHSKKF